MRTEARDSAVEVDRDGLIRVRDGYDDDYAVVLNEVDLLIKKIRDVRQHLLAKTFANS